MRYLFIILFLFSSSVLRADCPESVGYTFQNLVHTGFGQQTPSMYYQLQVNVTGVGASYLFIGYGSGGFVHNGTADIFNKIPKVEFDNDPHLRGFYRGYVSGELETAIHAAYNQPNINGTIDLLSFQGDDFLACEDPPPGPTVAVTMEELLPWFKHVSMLLGIIVIATCFRVGQAAWDLVLRAKNDYKFWSIIFVLILPSVANAQGTFCGDAQYYTGHTVNVHQDQNGFSSISMTVNWSNRPSMQGVLGGNGFYSSTFHGFFAVTGIPWDIIQSDSQLRAVVNASRSLQCRSDLGTPGTTIDIFSYPETTFSHCGCNLDPSHGGCPNYQPSGPDVPDFCADGITEDSEPDNANCGCPGQDYTVCDAECPDADNDLCCDDLDPKPDDPSCGCTRDGPTGECGNGDCPECDKLLSDYAEEFQALFAEFGIDLSPLLARGSNPQPIIITLPAPQFGPFHGHPGWQIATDEYSLPDSVAKTNLQWARLFIRNLILSMAMFFFVKSILRIFFK